MNPNQSNSLTPAKTIPDLQKALGEFRSGKPSGSLGLVPTMGALHAGHLSLVEESLRENDFTAVTIFVNPTQFNDPRDYEAYQINLERDLQLLQEAGADLCFAPGAEEIYPAGDSEMLLSLPALEKNLCGPGRPGHFAGVLLIVARWLNLFRPERAYFGKKDYQQFLLIKRMAQELYFPAEIIGLPTLREEDGLAMSSRNARLDEKSREHAELIYRALKLGKKTFESRDCAPREVREIVSDVIESGSLNKVDYVDIVHPETLEKLEDFSGHARVLIAVAVFCGPLPVRLIDNVECEREFFRND